jgi:hypothetical protein
MKQYTIFYRAGGNFYPIYKSKDTGIYWLGGSRMQWILFRTKSEATREAKLIKKQSRPFFEKGTIQVSLCRLQPW